MAASLQLGYLRLASEAEADVADGKVEAERFVLQLCGAGHLSFSDRFCRSLSKWKLQIRRWDPAW